MSASFPLTAAVLQHCCLHWVRATWATSTFYCQSGVGKINQNQWWKMFCFGFAVSKISTCVHKRKQNTELYFTELFWTSTNFYIHIVSIPPLIFLRVNCMVMATCFWIRDFIEMKEITWARSSAFFVSQYLPTHETSFILLSAFYAEQ